MHSNVHCIINHNSQDRETFYISSPLLTWKSVTALITLGHFKTPDILLHPLVKVVPSLFPFFFPLPFPSPSVFQAYNHNIG